MYITITEKQAKQNGIGLSEFETTEPDFTWHAALKRHDKKTYLFLINEATRFVIVTGELNRENFLEGIQEDIWQYLKPVQTDSNEIVNYMREAKKFECGIPINPELPVWIDEAAEMAFKMIETYPQDNLYENVTLNLNIVPVKTGSGEMIPFIKMSEMLSRYNPETLFRKKVRGPTNKGADRLMAKRKNFDTVMPLIKRKRAADVLEIKSSLSGSTVETERTILISADTSLEELSSILLKLYGAEGDPYEYSFDIESLTLSADKEPLNLKSAISEAFSTFTHIALNFGENWKVNLEVKATFPGCKSLCPFLPFLVSLHGPSPLQGMVDITDYNKLVYIQFNPFELNDDDSIRAFYESLKEKSQVEDFNALEKFAAPGKIGG